MVLNRTNGWKIRPVAFRRRQRRSLRKTAEYIVAGAGERGPSEPIPNLRLNTAAEGPSVRLSTRAHL